MDEHTELSLFLCQDNKIMFQTVRFFVKSNKKPPRNLTSGRLENEKILVCGHLDTEMTMSSTVTFPPLTVSTTA